MRRADNVIPAKAGIQSVKLFKNMFKAWIPAFAGMTILMFLFPIKSFALWEEPPKISTDPIGSSFYRHLAQDQGMDLRELVKFEKRGFGRTEVCTLLVISSSTKVPIKEYGKRRLKEKVSLRQLAADAQLNFDDVHTKAVALKERIEALGDRNLPPPLYELPAPTPTPEPKPKKEKKKKKTKAEKAAEKKPAPTPEPTLKPRLSELD